MTDAINVAEADVPLTAEERDDLRSLDAPDLVALQNLAVRAVREIERLRDEVERLRPMSVADQIAYDEGFL